MDILLRGDVTEELAEKIKGVLEGETGVEMNVLTTQKEKEETYQSLYEDLSVENTEKELIERVSAFLLEYAVELKNTDCQMPAYFTVIIGQEYDDDAYFNTIEHVRFFDEERRSVSMDFDVEWDGDDYEFSYALGQELGDHISVNAVERMEGRVLPVNL